MIGLILPNSLRYSQYLFKYKNLLDDKNVPYEIVLWNRDGSEVPFDNAQSFDKAMNDYSSLMKKAPLLLQYARFARTTIRKRRYDGLIVFTSPMAILLMPLLFLTYRGRYVFDYRDVSRERYGLYRSVIRHIASCSYFTAISSPAFSDVIGRINSPYVMSHNERDMTCRASKSESSKGDVIRAVYWGTIRQPSFNRMICEKFGSDPRFSLVYHGSGCVDELEEYCLQQGFENISFTGVYDEGQIASFAQEADLLMNCYENDSIQQFAFTVKYYDGLRYGIPSVVSAGSAMSQIMSEAQIGISVDWSDSDCMQKLYEAYLGFDFDLFEQSRKAEIERIEADDLVFERSLDGFLTSVNSAHERC